MTTKSEEKNPHNQKEGIEPTSNSKETTAGRIGANTRNRRVFCIGWNQYTIDEYRYSVDTHRRTKTASTLRTKAWQIDQNADVIDRHAYDKTDRDRHISRHDQGTNKHAN